MRILLQDIKDGDELANDFSRILETLAPQSPLSPIQELGNFLVVNQKFGRILQKLEFSVCCNTRSLLLPGLRVRDG